MRRWNVLWGLCLLLGSCAIRSSESVAVAVVPLPTLAAVAPTLTPLNTYTPIPTSTATFTPTPTATPTPSPTPTTTPIPIDRTCPDPPPSKPFYERRVLGAERWPTPVPNPQTHFWLDKPFLGEGRYLFNTTFPYGYDANGAYLLHNGIDTGQRLGTPLVAVADGTVIVAQRDDEMLYGWRCDWYGHLVVIELDQRWQGQPVYALYGHVLNIAVEVGQRVRAGEQVAEVGYGGAAIVPHLHFEVRVGQNDFGATRNPLLWVEPPRTRGVVVGRLLDPSGRPWQGMWISAIHDEDRTETITWSYLDDPRHLINPDQGFAENFVIADLLPGSYTLYTEVQDEVYEAQVTVQGGAVSTVEIIAAVTP